MGHVNDFRPPLEKVGKVCRRHDTGPLASPANRPVPAPAEELDLAFEPSRRRAAKEPMI
jgi:hypothetical protein